ncbi:hypothetical protein CRENBAI_008242 [Crenichthys baileyi]|uniref:Uncharacterized protein n=1 Tax=Crenichthys baileyi TaxID=28760 RepID=A0AAV9QRP0_9TELE
MELADSREEMELAPAGPGSGRGAVDLFTFLSRDAEKTLRHSAGLSVPQSAYYGSRLAIPCPGTGPLRHRPLPAHLAAHSSPAVKPSPSSRPKKRRRGPPSCSAGKEVVSLPADVRAAASKPTSSPATAPSPRLAAAPPMPSSLTPARCSEATPDELEERLRFFARQIKTFRNTSLLYSSPELMERIRQMEEDYGTAVRQFYCRPPPSMPGLQGAAAAAEQPTPGLQGAAVAAEQPTPGLQGAAAAAEQPTPGLQGAAAAEQPTPGLQGAAAAAEQPTPGLQGAAVAAEQPTAGLQGAAAAAEQPTPGLQSAAAEQPTPGLQSAAAEQPTPGLQPAVELSEGPEGRLPPLPGPEHLLSFLCGVLMELKPDTHPDTPQPVSARPDTPQPVSARPDTPHHDTPHHDTPHHHTPHHDTPHHDTPQPDSGPDPKSASTSSTRRRGRRKRDTSVHATEGLGDASAPAHAAEGLAPAHPAEGLCDASAPAHAAEGSPGSVSASEGSPGSASASEGSPGSASASEGSPGSASASEGSPGRRPPELCPCWGRPPGRPPELCPCFWTSCHGPLRPPGSGCFLFGLLWASGIRP